MTKTHYLIILLFVLFTYDQHHLKSNCFQLDHLKSINEFNINDVSVNDSSSKFIRNQNLLIGSFNIQSLGPTKMSRPEFISIASRILAKYDIVLIQEIKDSSSSMNVINDLLKSVNKLFE